MAGSRTKLPVVDARGEQNPSCGTKAYVSLEESSILAAIRSLRERAQALRAELAADADPEARRALNARLEALRAERRDLVTRREKAYVRKMVMLGHLPPEALEGDGS